MRNFTVWLHNKSSRFPASLPRISLLALGSWLAIIRVCTYLCSSN